LVDLLTYSYLLVNSNGGATEDDGSLPQATGLIAGKYGGIADA
jgi:hypothetical protein